MIYKLKVSLFISAITFTQAAYSTQIPATVMADYQAGLHGDIKANANAIESMTLLIAQDKNDPLVLSLLGSSETIKARFVEQPWSKMKFVEKGMSRLDKSLRLLKKDATVTPKTALIVTTTAGCTFVKLPKMFNRFEQGYGLLKGLIGSKSFSYAPVRAQVAAYLCAVEAATKAEDITAALVYIDAVIAIAPTGAHITTINHFKEQLEG